MSTLFKRFNLSIWLVLMLIIGLTSSYADEIPNVLETSKGDLQYVTCDKDILIGVKSKFEDIRDKAINLAVSDCKSIVDSRGDATLFDSAKLGFDRKSFTEFVKDKTKSDLGGFNGFDKFISDWSNVIINGEKASFLVKSELGAPTYIELLSARTRIVLGSDDKCKAIGYGGKANPFDSCNDMGEELQKAIDVVGAFRTIDQLDTVGKYVVGLENSWKKFVDYARFQTTLDVMVTTWAFSDKWKSAELQGPPPIQYFLLHPMLTYTYMSDATRGEELKPVPAVEWIGVNFWKAKVPLGASITSIYNDRPNGKKFLLGLTIHVDNSYSIGMAGTGNERTFFMNLDLMEWFGDKKEKFNKYQHEFDSYREKLKQ
jgi:hypothetical protein